MGRDPELPSAMPGLRSFEGRCPWAPQNPRTHFRESPSGVGLLFRRRQYLVQPIGRGLDPLQVRIAHSAVVVQGDCDELVAAL